MLYIAARGPHGSFDLLALGGVESKILCTRGERGTYRGRVLDFARKITHPDVRRVAQKNGRAYHRMKLAHIARPRILHKAVKSFGRNRGVPPGLGAKMFNEAWNVLRAIP